MNQSKRVGRTDDENDPHRRDNFTKMKLVLPVGKQKAWELIATPKGIASWHPPLRGKGGDRRNLGILLARRHLRKLRSQILGGKAFCDSTALEGRSDTPLLSARSIDDPYPSGRVPSNLSGSKESKCRASLLGVLSCKPEINRFGRS